MSFPGPLFLGLTGYPLQHSLSPLLHTAALQSNGLDGRYDLFPIPPGNLQELKKLTSRLRALEIHGLNVTIPHKQHVLSLVDVLTPTARAIGAVNTLFMKDNLLVGDNTDAPGFLQDLKRNFSPQPGEALILGAGGAARAIVAALRETGWQVTLTARRAEQAFGFTTDFPGLAFLPLTAEALAQWQPARSALIVNATSAGMSPHSESTPWPEGLPFPARAFVYDLVYNPAETTLLRTARQAGLNGCSGLGMLVEQAALAFELWATCLDINLAESPRLAMWQAVKIQYR